MNRAAQLTVLLLVLTACVSCDQAFKGVARSTLADAPPVSYLNDFIRFEYAENYGAFLSLGARLPDTVRFLLLEVLVGFVLAAGLAAMFSERIGLPQKAALAIALGGGLGNLIDRVLHGAVVDFVSVGIGPLRTGVFNLADVAITAGMLAILWLSNREHPAREASST